VAFGSSAIPSAKPSLGFVKLNPPPEFALLRSCVARRFLVFLPGSLMPKNLALSRNLVAAAVIAASSSVAMADATAAFTAEVTALSASVVTYGGLLVGLSAVGVAFMIGIKYIKKLRGAA
jgi:hypothetical protein